MKQISFKAFIKEQGTDRTWQEEFSDLVVDDMTPMQCAKFLIRRFNDTLRPGEKPREVVRVRSLEVGVLKEHNWGKISFRSDDEGYYPYQCAACGATGKRHGSVNFITPDRKHTIYCKSIMRRTT
jgi:hypothetical protein